MKTKNTVGYKLFDTISCWISNAMSYGLFTVVFSAIMLFLYCKSVNVRQANTRDLNQGIYNEIVGTSYYLTDGYDLHSGNIYQIVFYKTGEILYNTYYSDTGKSTGFVLPEFYGSRIFSNWEIMDDGKVRLTDTWSKLYLMEPMEDEDVKEGDTEEKVKIFEFWSARDNNKPPICVAPRSIVRGFTITEIGHSISNALYLTSDIEGLKKYCKGYATNIRKSRLANLRRRFGNKYAPLILDGLIAIGMTKEMVIESIGEPTETYRTVTVRGVSEQWFYRYPGSYLYFLGNKLYSFQD
jgi:hypothetical protein